MKGKKEKKKFSCDVRLVLMRMQIGSLCSFFLFLTYVIHLDDMFTDMIVLFSFPFIFCRIGFSASFVSFPLLIAHCPSKVVFILCLCKLIVLWFIISLFFFSFLSFFDD